MKHPVKAVSDERAAIIAHIEAKAAGVSAMADAGRIKRDFADEIARVLTELAGDLRNEFHILDRKEAEDGESSESIEDTASGDRSAIG